MALVPQSDDAMEEGGRQKKINECTVRSRRRYEAAKRLEPSSCYFGRKNEGIWSLLLLLEPEDNKTCDNLERIQVQARPDLKPSMLFAHVVRVMA